MSGGRGAGAPGMQNLQGDFQHDGEQPFPD